MYMNVIIGESININTFVVHISTLLHSHIYMYIYSKTKWTEDCTDCTAHKILIPIPHIGLHFESVT